MIYKWHCKECGMSVSKISDMKSYKDAPSNSCPLCGLKNWEREFSRPFVAVDIKTEDNPFPIRVEGLIKEPLVIDGVQQYNNDGTPTIVHKDVVFQDARQQQDWLKDHGMVLYESTRDTLHDKRRRLSDEAPSQRALDLANQAKYMEQDDILSMLKE